MEKPVGWYKGKPGGTVRLYSDVLLMYLLKGLRPEKYRERVEVRETLSSIDLNRLTDEQLARISAGGIRSPYWRALLSAGCRVTHSSGCRRRQRGLVRRRAATPRIGKGSDRV